MQKHPQVSQWSSRDYRTYKSLAGQTKVKSHSNPRGSTRPRATWKYKHILRRMTVPGESIPEEESEDTNGTDTDSMVDISGSSPAGPGILSPGMPSPYTRSYGKTRKTKDRGAPSKVIKAKE